jgi:hypothetical protein
VQRHRKRRHEARDQPEREVAERDVRHFRVDQVQRPRRREHRTHGDVRERQQADDVPAQRHARPDRASRNGPCNDGRAQRHEDLDVATFQREQPRREPELVEPRDRELRPEAEHLQPDEQRIRHGRRKPSAGGQERDEQDGGDDRPDKQRRPRRAQRRVAHQAEPAERARVADPERKHRDRKRAPRAARRAPEQHRNGCGHEA